MELIICKGRVGFKGGGKNEIIISREMIEGRERGGGKKGMREETAQRKEENEYTHKSKNMYMMLSGEKSTSLN